MDLASKMQAEELTSVQPIEFKEHDTQSFKVKHFVDGDNLILQVFPKRDIDVLGGRVAKALVDTLGEAGMRRVNIELHDDPSISKLPSVYVKCLELGSDYYREYITGQLLDNLDQCLSAMQA